MQSKIIFLGTGGDPTVVGKQLRGSGGIVLQVGDNQFHIDPGPGALVRCSEYNVNPRNNVAVLVSHNHLNHANDVNAVIDAMTLGGFDKHGVLVTNKTVLDDTPENDSYLTKHHRDCVERAISLETGQRVGINNIEIRATRVKHNDPYGIGFKFLTPEFILGYTSDTGYSADIANDFKDVDLMIVNVQNPGEQKKEYKLCTAEAAKIIEQIKPKLAIITHFGIKMISGDVLSEAREIQKRTGVQTIAARDGMVINPVSYSVNLRQKTLNLYKT